MDIKEQENKSTNRRRIGFDIDTTLYEKFEKTRLFLDSGTISHAIRRLIEKQIDSEKSTAIQASSPAA